jgi:glycosyltransferase involved in cell wall biosynthesis
MKVLVISPHPEGIVPGQRLKYEQYFDYFRENGIEVEVSPFICNAFQDILYTRGNTALKIIYTLRGYIQRTRDLFRLRDYDAIYIFLYVTPFGPPVFEWLYSKFQPRFIYDIDDLVFLKAKSKANPIATWIKGRKKMAFLMKRARHVITCTPFLDQYARQFTQHTTDISSTINTDTYLPDNTYQNGKTLTIGWSGSHSTSQYLHLLTEVLKKVQSEFDIKILVIGDPDFKLPGVDVKAIPWRRETEVEDLQQIDIGLYPLPDEQWVHGKSGLKALQYMALGIPTVASAIGANYRVMEHRVSGFLVKTHEEWYTAIVQLIQDPALRSDIGRNARNRVEQYYSIRANRDVYLSILKNVMQD